MPAISVVIPLYNKAPYVARCLASVEAQTFRDFEVIVVDDGSTDGSGEIASAHLGPKGRLVRQDNAGVSAARNAGIEASEGAIVALLDADDEWLPTHLADLWELHELFPDAGLLATGYRLQGADIVQVRRIPGEAPRTVDYFGEAERAHLIHSSSVAVRRDVINGVGGFLLGEPLGEDREYWARVSLSYALSIHPRVSAVYHYVPRCGQSVSEASQGPRLAYTAMERLLAEGEFPPDLFARARDYAAASRLREARIWVKNEFYEQALELLVDNSLDRPVFRQKRWVLWLQCIVESHAPSRLRPLVRLPIRLLARCVSLSARLVPW